MNGQYILALDQGTTSSRAVLFDHDGNVVSVAQKEFQQIYPQPGWVEHDPQEIWSTQAGVAAEAVAHAGLTGGSIAAIGITNLSLEGKLRLSVVPRKKPSTCWHSL